jgi:hypothetical protein
VLKRTAIVGQIARSHAKAFWHHRWPATPHFRFPGQHY